MYKTLNMSTNVRSASRTSFVAQFKQLTVLLAFLWDRNINALSSKRLQRPKSLVGTLLVAGIMLSHITLEREHASNEAEWPWTFKKRIQNWPFATKCCYLSAKNQTNLLGWLLPASWVLSGRIAEKLRVQVVLKFATSRLIYQQTFGFA